MCNFSTPSDHHSQGSWDKSKNPYPLRNHIIPDLTTGVAPTTTWPAALWLLCPISCLVGNYAMSQWEWILAIVCNRADLRVIFLCLHAEHGAGTSHCGVWWAYYSVTKRPCLPILPAKQSWHFRWLVITLSCHLFIQHTFIDNTFLWVLRRYHVAKNP